MAFNFGRRPPNEGEQGSGWNSPGWTARWAVDSPPRWLTADDNGRSLIDLDDETDRSFDDEEPALEELLAVDLSGEDTPNLERVTVRKSETERTIIDLTAPTPNALSMIECACCFDDIALSAATFCSNPTPHYFCFNCATRTTESEVLKSKSLPSLITADNRFNIKCMDFSNCEFEFAESEIRRFLDPKVFQRFDQLRTDHELRQAGLDGLVWCPFCPFAGIMEDVEDTVFECLRCNVSSCRHCRVKSHRPLSCEEYQRDRTLAPRHIVEEAMTEALIRKCNICSFRFLKSDGCNKITCPQCGNKQCFVCSENVSTYDHFDNKKKGRKGCPMYGDMKDLLRREVMGAQKKTVKRLLEEREGLKEEELVVEREEEGHARKRRKISVEEKENRRVGAGEAGQGFPGTGGNRGRMPTQPPRMYRDTVPSTAWVPERVAPPPPTNAPNRIPPPTETTFVWNWTHPGEPLPPPAAQQSNHPQSDPPILATPINQGQPTLGWSWPEVPISETSPGGPPQLQWEPGVAVPQRWEQAPPIFPPAPPPSQSHEQTSLLYPPSNNPPFAPPPPVFPQQPATYLPAPAPLSQFSPNIQYPLPPPPSPQHSQYNPPPSETNSTQYNPPAPNPSYYPMAPYDFPPPSQPQPFLPNSSFNLKPVDLFGGPPPYWLAWGPPPMQENPTRVQEQGTQTEGSIGVPGQQGSWREPHPWGHGLGG